VRPSLVLPLHLFNRSDFVQVLLLCLGHGTLFARLSFADINASSQARCHCPHSSFVGTNENSVSFGGVHQLCQVSIGAGGRVCT
jgi:hypothetical protein